MDSDAVAALVVDLPGGRSASFPAWAPQHADEYWALSFGIRPDDRNGGLPFIDADRCRIDDVHPEPIYPVAPPCLSISRRYSRAQRLKAINIIRDHRRSQWRESDGDIVDDIAHALGLWRYYDGM